MSSTPESATKPASWTTAFQRSFAKLAFNPPARHVAESVYPISSSHKTWRTDLQDYLNAVIGTTTATEHLAGPFLERLFVEAEGHFAGRLGEFQRTCFRLGAWCEAGADLIAGTRQAAPAPETRESLVREALFAALGTVIRPFMVDAAAARDPAASLKKLSSACDNGLHAELLVDVAAKVFDGWIDLWPEEGLADLASPYLTDLNREPWSAAHGVLAEECGLTIQYDHRTVALAVRHYPDLDTQMRSQPKDAICTLILERHGVEYAEHLLRLLMDSQVMRVALGASAPSKADIGKFSLRELCKFVTDLTTANNLSISDEKAQPPPSVDLPESYFAPPIAGKADPYALDGGLLWMIDLTRAQRITTAQKEFDVPFPTIIAKKIAVEPSRVLVQQSYALNIAIARRLPLADELAYRRIMPVLLPLPPLSLPLSDVVMRPVPAPPCATYPPYAAEVIHYFLQAHPSTSFLDQLCELLDPTR